MKCSSLNSLLGFIRGDGSAEERAAIQAHLAGGCANCEENRRWLEDVWRLTAADKSYVLPEELIQRAVAAFTAQAATPRLPLRQIFAQLIFDGFYPRQLAEVRSAPSRAMVGRHFHYRTEAYDIDLRFERPEGAEAEEMIGQILPRDAEKVAEAPPQQSMDLSQLVVQLLQQGAEVGIARADMRGVFRFAQLPSGTYSLKIHVPEGEINIEAIETASAAS